MKGMRNEVLLYRGRKPTALEMKMKNIDTNPVIVIDETGSINSLKSDEISKRKFFVVVGALVSNPKSFKGIHTYFPKAKTETKYSKTTLRGKERIFEKLCLEDFTFTSIHKSRRNECLKNKRNQIITYIDLISRTIAANDPGIPHNILIDSPPINAANLLIDLCIDMYKGGSRIEWFEVRSSSRDYILQVHDFITGVVGDNVEGIKDSKHLYDMICNKGNFINPNK